MRGRGLLLAGVLVAAAALAGRALSQTPPPVPKPRTDLAAIAWMAGAWRGETEGGTAEEHWMAPAGGTMLGSSRVVSEGQTVFYEFMLIRDRGELGTLLTVHVKGAEGVKFRLARAGEREAIFENPDHDFPQRIVYYLKDGKGQELFARIEGMRRGSPEKIDFAFKRVKE